MAHDHGRRHHGRHRRAAPAREVWASSALGLGGRGAIAFALLALAWLMIGAVIA